MVLRLLVVLTVFFSAFATTEKESPAMNAEEDINTKLMELVLPRQELIVPQTNAKRNPYARLAKIVTVDDREVSDEPRTAAQQYELSALRYVGYVEKDGKPTAMIRLPSKETVFLGIGERIGLQRGRILRISGQKVTIEEIDHSGDTKKRKNIKEISLED